MPGHPIQIRPATEPDDGNQIVQWASTGDEIKYCVRRAFVRLLMEEMHKNNVEVNVQVL